MKDFLVFMHDDVQEDTAANSDAAWEKYLKMLSASGRFSGGSAIGPGVCVNKTGHLKQISAHLTGYIRLQAETIEGVEKLLGGNPVLESGGTVEIRELPRT